MALVAVWAAGLAVWAEDAPGSTARLSSVEGSARIVSGDQVVADPALVNAPLFEGAQLTTAEDGKAEIQFEDGSVARLSPTSALTLVTLAGSAGSEVALDGGLAYFEVPAGASHPLHIRLGDSTVSAGAGSVLRIRLDTPSGELSVFSGSAHLERGNALSVDVPAGSSITLDAADATRYNLVNKIAPDSWDEWNQDRDQALNASLATQSNAAGNAVGDAAQNPAWADLDASGSWYNVPGTGYVWSPFAASTPGWDPYGCGHWMWTPRWGYVWVSCESWGFMPYMCGGWSYYSGFGWGWGPGMGMGCGMGWGGGSFGGAHLGSLPPGYRIPSVPGPRRPIGRFPMPIGVHRRGPVDAGLLPSRSTQATIGGQAVRPIDHGSERSTYLGSQSFMGRSDGFGRSGATSGSTTANRMVYGVPTTSGSTPANKRPGYLQGRPDGQWTGRSGNTGAQRTNAQPQQQGFQQQQRNGQQSSQSGGQRPSSSYNPTPSRSSSSSGSSSGGGFHSSPSGPSPSMGGGGGSQGGGGGSHSSGGNSGGGHK